MRRRIAANKGGTMKSFFIPYTKNGFFVWGEKAFYF